MTSIAQADRHCERRAEDRGTGSMRPAKLAIADLGRDGCELV